MLQAVDTFQRLTGYPLVNYLQQVGQFLRSGYAPILAYYAGTAPLDAQAFAELADLREQARRIAELHRQHRAHFSSYEDWQLLEQLEAAETRLHTVAQLAKYLRTGTTGAGQPRAGTQATYTPGRGTLEQVARQLGGTEDDWQQLALDNQLQEQDYTPEGRRPLQVTLPTSRQAPQRDVLGSAQGELALGRDLPHQLQLDEPQQDLLVLTPQQTAGQAIDRLLQLRRGDVPELPNLGLRAEQVVGASAKLLGLPAILRQLAEVLATDDTLQAFQTSGVSTHEDQLTIACTITTVYPTAPRQTPIKLG